MLLAIRDYLQLVGSASLTNLARHFNVQPSAMQGMMEQWIRKGHVTISAINQASCPTASCKGCTVGQCEDDHIIYHWQNS